MEEGAVAVADDRGIAAAAPQNDDHDRDGGGDSPLNRRRPLTPTGPSGGSTGAITPPRRGGAPPPPPSSPPRPVPMEAQLSHQASSFSIPGPPAALQLERGQVSSFIRANVFRAFGGGGARGNGNSGGAGASQRCVGGWLGEQKGPYY